MNDLHEEAIQCPSILFRLNGGLYCVDSHDVSTIMELPGSWKPLPDAPPYITGIFPFRDKSVTMFDLRAALKQPSLALEYQDFCKMLDARKQDHINWVSSLERSIQDDTPFTLATDPHKCALGKWYDSFDTDSSELAYHMAKLSEPHQLLHEAAKKVQQCNDNHTGEKAQYCKESIFHQVHDVYMQQVLGILEDAKSIFRSRAFHEMVLVLSGARSLGIVVDEVLSVEMVSEEKQGAHQQLLSYSPYITRIVRSEKYDDLILEVSIASILSATERDNLVPEPAKA